MYRDLYEFIKIMSSESNIYKNYIFTIPFLRLLNKNILTFIFDLITTAKNIKLLPNTKENLEILKFLTGLQIIEKKNQNIFLNTDFRNSILNGFTKDRINRNFKIINENKEPIEYYHEIFNKKLQTFVKLIIDGDYKKNFIWDLIIFSGVVNDDMKINNKGFEFLLMTKNEKVWFFILKVIEMLSCKKINPCKNMKIKYDNRIGIYNEIENLKEKMILNVFEIGMLEVGVTYEVSENIDLNLLYFLNEFGIINFNNKKFILNFNFFGENISSETILIVETNYKFYAYLNSDYATNILKLFGEIHLKLPNLVVGQITEESIQKAFEKGITGNQIINYLKTGKQLPISVSEQILIWENKKYRIKDTESYLYKGFNSLSEFEKVLNFCKSKNFLVDFDIDKKILIIKTSGHQDVKSFIKNFI